jgi:hypothetical protein
MLAGYLLHVLSSDILKIERISAAASGCAPVTLGRVSAPLPKLMNSDP